MQVAPCKRKESLDDLIMAVGKNPPDIGREVAGVLFYISWMFVQPEAAGGLTLGAALMPDCLARHLPVKANANTGVSSGSANAPSWVK